MKEHVLILSKGDHSALGSIRSVQGLQVAEDEDLLVRGVNESLLADKRIRQLPVLHTYCLDEHQQLFPLGGLTPTKKLAHLEWIPIAEFIKPELPVSALPAKPQARHWVRLVKACTTCEGAAMMTSLNTLKAYAETAAAIRLEHLKFAVSSNEDVLLIGTPLPAIPGHEYYFHESILLPAGYAFEAPVFAQLLKRKLNSAEDSVVAVTTAGDWHKVPLQSFAKATRSAIRLTNVIENEW
jgi:hypothetical protein